jgi:hypothetical protein
VHQHERGSRPGAEIGERRIAQPGDVVDDRRAGRDRRLGHRRLVRVHRDERAELARRALDHRHHPRRLDLGRHRRTPADRRLPTHVDQIRSGREQLGRPRHAGLDAGWRTAVGEGVRRRVHHAHQQRSLAQLEHAARGAQDQRATS